MALFGRRKAERSTREDGAIGAFWDWWNQGGHQKWAQVAGQGMPPQELVDELRARVEAIADGLAWEVAAGSESVHQLVVTADGDPDLRAIARRWLLAAPESDPIWSYADSRQAVVAVEDVGLQLGERTLSGTEAQVGVRRVGSRVDVTVFHPGFAELSEEERSLALFVLLDQTLGERQTETWIGELSPSEVPPLDGFGLSGLRAVVRDLAAECSDENGEPLWALFEGESPNGLVTASAQIPLAAAGWPLLDRYVRVEVTYEDQQEDGLPDEAGRAALSELETSLTGAVGEDGRVVGHETTGGVRALHLYVDGRTDAPARVEAAAKQWDRSARVTHESDPGWSAVQHLRG